MKTIPVIFSLIFSSLSLPAMSAVSLVFKDGKKFIDYELTADSPSKSLKTLHKDFSRLFDALSKNYLTEDQKMEVVVSNIDLVGDMRPSPTHVGQMIRVVKGHGFIRIYFSFKVSDSSGKLIKEGEFKLDEVIKNGSSQIPNRQFANITHFVKPLKNWFWTTFK